MDISIDFISNVVSKSISSVERSIVDSYTADPVLYAKKHGKLEGMRALKNDIKMAIAQYLKENGEEGDEDDFKNAFK